MTDDKPGLTEERDNPAMAEAQDKPAVATAQEQPGMDGEQEQPAASTGQEQPAMAEGRERPDVAQGQEKPRMTLGKIVAIAAIMLLTACAGVVVGVVVSSPSQAISFVQQLTGHASSTAGSSGGGTTDLVPMDTAEGDLAKEVAAETPTRQIAAFGDIPIYSPITQSEITGVLFHQASFSTGQVMTTQLPEANVEGLGTENPVRVNRDQTEGDWVDADALHLYRETDTTLMDTSIDVGAPWGSIVYAPVTGTVVLVKDYDLYGYVPDVQIHIQPDGHPELDLVLLHQYDPYVKAGDRVEGGRTPLSRVRDIAASLTDIQLGFYTAADDPGNHSHVQMNDANSPGYREDSLKDAYQVPAQ